MERRTALWLSHHWPDDYDRCARVGGRHVCRRCLALYPVWLAVTLLAVAGLRWPLTWDWWLLWLLPLPAVVEWWLEHLGRVTYSPSRNVALSMVAAVGLGVGFHRYLLDPTDLQFWAEVVVYGVACLVPALLWRRPAAAGEGEGVSRTGAGSTR